MFWVFSVFQVDFKHAEPAFDSFGTEGRFEHLLY